MSEEWGPWLRGLWDRVDFNQETGEMTWRAKPPLSNEDRRWNSRYAGKPAFSSLNSRGYLSGVFQGRGVLAHCAVWFFVTGEWPKLEIDHINGVKDDNRPGNLRQVDRQGNCQNAALYKSNSSGIAGVNRRGDRWIARIQIRGERKMLGTFATLESAAEARREAQSLYGFSARHGSANFREKEATQ